MHAQISSITIASEQPGELALFYSELLGLGMLGALGDEVNLRRQSRSPGLSFTRPDRCHPTVGTRPHIHIGVADMDEAVSLAKELGGEVVGEAPEGTVMKDPDGNPFCFMLMTGSAAGSSLGSWS